MTIAQDQSGLRNSGRDAVQPPALSRQDKDTLASMDGLRALALLGGSVRAGRLSGAIGRSMLDLPVEPRRRVLQIWQDHAAELAGTLSTGALPIRVIVDQTSPAPAQLPQRQGIEMQIERDPLNFRGTAGVLHDIARDYADDDLLLVATGAQILLEPLAVLVAELAAKKTDISLIAHDDGIPSGLVLLRCRCLRRVADIGFVDFKEQALPAIASQHSVAVVRRSHPSGLPMRTLPDYIAALRYYHRAPNKPAHFDPLAEDWLPSFAVVEAGAEVASEARVHDSVVLAGGRLERGAVVVHSVVCPDGVVPHGSMVDNQIVSGGIWRAAHEA